MKVTVLGTGSVGKVIAEALVKLGHNVTIGTRNVANTMANEKADNYGGLPFAEWHKKHQTVSLKAYGEAAQDAAVIFNCTQGAGSISALEAVGDANLGDKILVDIANPLDFSQGFPPSLFLVNTTSLGEEIQKRFPDLKVVKTLNMVNCLVMVNAALSTNGGDKGTMFLSGNDAAAKQLVINEFLTPWHWDDLIDLGDITTARGTEQLLPIWIRTWAATQNGTFAFKVIR